MCVFLCVSVSLIAQGTHSLCSRADTSPRLGCNYMPLSAPSLRPKEEEEEGMGRRGANWGRLVHTMCVSWSTTPPHFTFDGLNPHRKNWIEEKNLQLFSPLSARIKCFDTRFIPLCLHWPSVTMETKSSLLVPLHTSEDTWMCVVSSFLQRQTLGLYPLLI